MTPTDFVAEISRDHAEISDVVRSLRRALAERDFGEARSLLVALQDLETKHYATEEALMQAVAYAEAAAHRAEHTSLLDMLGRINQALALETPTSISPSIVAHLEAAIAHMMHADEKLNRFVLERVLRS